MHPGRKGGHKHPVLYEQKHSQETQHSKPEYYVEDKDKLKRVHQVASKIVREQSKTRRG